jgi:hypothetical protein
MLPHEALGVFNCRFMRPERLTVVASFVCRKIVSTSRPLSPGFARSLNARPFERLAYELQSVIVSTRTLLLGVRKTQLAETLHMWWYRLTVCVSTRLS